MFRSAAQKRFSNKLLGGVSQERRDPTTLVHFAIGRALAWYPSCRSEPVFCRERRCHWDKNKPGLREVNQYRSLC